MKEIAGIKPHKKKQREKVYATEKKLYHTVSRIASRLWRIYVIICAVLFLSVGLYRIEQRYSYVELPNGVKFTPITTLPGVVLKHRDGHVLTPSHVIQIIWNDRYIMGYTTPSSKAIRFVYKVDSTWEVVEDRDYMREEFLELSEESGLADKKITEYKKFKELLNNPLYRRTWRDGLLDLLRRKTS
jgi:hypothetical protein